MNKRTRATSITQKTKRAVYERQNGRSVLSGLPISVSDCCCHYIGRASSLGSGVGFEWNIVGLTQDEHRMLDESKAIFIAKRFLMSNEDAKKTIREHLEIHYENWSEENCRYKKIKKEEDYAVKRRESI